MEVYYNLRVALPHPYLVRNSPKKTGQVCSSGPISTRADFLQRGCPLERLLSPRADFFQKALCWGSRFCLSSVMHFWQVCSSGPGACALLPIYSSSSPKPCIKLEACMLLHVPFHHLITFTILASITNHNTNAHSNYTYNFIQEAKIS